MCFPKKILMTAFFFLMVPYSQAVAQDKLTQIKAVFLFKFASYVTWPTESSLTAGGQFNLCIWGAHSFGNTLDVIARKQTEYHYKILYYKNDETPKNCHLIYTELPVHQARKIKNTLLVSDQKGFAQQGGMIEMDQEEGKIKLTGNLNAAEEAGFKISSRLLGIMDVIR